MVHGNVEVADCVDHDEAEMLTLGVVYVDRVENLVFVEVYGGAEILVDLVVCGGVADVSSRD